jgi:hypothetical protein
MGQAKKKASQVATWLETLSPDERKVFAVARAAYENIVKAQSATGMCYRTTFFMTAYLAKEQGLQVEPVVGYVNDGTDDLMISHAWVEIGGKKTDINLTMTEHPHAQLTGPLLILDKEFTRGAATYTYHRERGATAALRVKELMEDPRARNFLRHKEAEHTRMTAIAKDLKLIHEYLNAAPDGLGYELLARMISSAGD